MTLPAASRSVSTMDEKGSPTRPVRVDAKVVLSTDVFVPVANYDVCDMMMRHIHKETAEVELT